MSSIPMPWDFALILLVLAVIVPWRGAVKVRQLLARPSLDTSDRLALYATTIAFQWIAATLIFWRAMARGISPESLGFNIPSTRLVAGVSVGLSVILVANQIIAFRILSRSAIRPNGFLLRVAARLMPQNLVESLAFGALVATVAVCEEIIYRGFAQLALAHVARDTAAAGLVLSSLLFAVAHAYQGRRGMIQTFIIGCLFAFVRIWTNSLIPTISAHFCADLAAGIVAPRLLLGETKPSAGEGTARGNRASGQQ